MESMNILLNIFSIISGLFSLTSFLVLVIKPIREKIFNIRKSKAGELCLLRTEMLKIYYKNEDAKQIKEYEYKNFVELYEAYIALGGNSFIKDVNEKVREWEILR